MRIKNQFPLIRKTLYGIMLLGLFFSAFGTENIQSVRAQEEDPTDTPTTEVQVQETATPTPETPVQMTATPTADGQTQTTVTPTSEVEAQIVGGQLADPGEYPWQVELSIYKDGSYYLCGGTLVHVQWVLTAAHCITKNDGSVPLATSITVYAGEYDTSGINGGVMRGAIQIIRHPSYNNYTLDSDIALIKLDTPLTIGNGANPPYTKISTISLVPAAVGSLAGTNSWVTGWGRTSYGGSTSSQLREVQLPIIDNSTCNDYSRWGGQITDNMLCAGSDAGTQSSCQGDSGGPLIVWNSGTGQWNLAGVVSFGPIGCAVPYAPSVFTRVSQYGSWVNNYILDPAVLTAPKNAIGAEYNPVYIWSKVANVTYYHLYVSGPSGLVTDQWFESSSICDATTCTAIPGPSATLGGGNYSWYVQTYNPVGYGPWSNNSLPTTFSTTALTTPAAAVLTAPKNNIGTDYNPNYTWDKVASATYYRLYVSGPSGVVLDQWYPAASICPIATCSVASPSLGGGAYAWYVQTYNPIGYGPWSNNTQPTNFSTTAPTAPAAAVLTAPKNDIATNYYPTYTWGRVATATYYHLYVAGPSGVVLDQWYQASIICDATTCSVASPSLGGGAYVWYVQTYNAAGYGPWSNNTQPTNFNTSTATTPGVILTAPKNDIGTDYVPNYTWTDVDGAIYYRLYVSGPSGVVLDKWYKYDEICDPNSPYTCSVPSPALGGGAHVWYVQTYGPTGYGPWSNNAQPTNFSTTMPSAPATAVLTAPKNAIGTDYTPNYTWDKVPTATYYRLYVSGPSGVVLDQWYPVSSICKTTTCSVSSPILAGGAYVWYVQTYNAAGYGPWSNNTQPTNFNTTTPSTPVGAVLTAPSGTIPLHTPTYAWNRVSMATWYRLYIKGPSGVVKDQWYQASSVCDTTTCLVNSPTLESGFHTWWIQTYNSAGYGPWKNATFTVNP